MPASVGAVVLAEVPPDELELLLEEDEELLDEDELEDELLLDDPLDELEADELEEDELDELPQLLAVSARFELTPAVA